MRSILLCALLALGVAVTQIQLCYAETGTSSPVSSANEGQGVSVRFHAEKTHPTQKILDLDDAINKLRASASKFSLPYNMMEPWWKTMQHDPDASWILRHFDSMSTDFERQWPFSPGLGAYVLRLDLNQTDKEIVITAEVPGINESNLDVNVNEDSVTIKGEKKEETTESESKKGGAYQRLERTYGSFERIIVLPSRVDINKAHATLKAGVLQIVLPKSSPPQTESKKLKVESF
jgi:HSP20 family protein